MRAVQNKWLELTWHIPGPLYKEKCQIYLQLWNVYAVYCNVFLPIRQTAKIPSRSEEFIALLIPSNPFYSKYPIHTRAHLAMTNYTKVWIRWLTVRRASGSKKQLHNWSPACNSIPTSIWMIAYIWWIWLFRGSSDSIYEYGFKEII